MAAGVVLLAVGVWLAADAVIRGTGRVPWLTLAALILGAPLVVAYTLRPAVYANAERLKIRNPFRTITLPWSAVEGVRSGYSSEVFAAGTKYQLWAIPVSLRARKKAARQQARAAMDAPRGRTTPPPTTSRRPGATTPEEPPRAPSDQAIEDLRDLAERHAADPAAQGEPTVRWAYEILAPVVAGLVLLGVLLLVG
ncbi:PH domain-containing protein [Streptomyces sp. NPDC002851]